MMEGWSPATDDVKRCMGEVFGGPHHDPSVYFLLIMPSVLSGPWHLDLIWRRWFQKKSVFRWSMRSPSDASRSRWGGGAEPVLGPCRLRGGVRLPPSAAPSLPHPPTARAPRLSPVQGRRGGGRPPLLPNGARGGGIHADRLPLLAHHRRLFVRRPRGSPRRLLPPLEVSTPVLLFLSSLDFISPHDTHSWIDTSVRPAGYHSLPPCGDLASCP
ncbi:hypothetical protein AVEN_96099-1 [Araneus ventricosus]|uniref:Uncharacterized protein n=1 Tax=Araneus ventricosus TaxID=182803 RepID=A0A4Y2B5Z7_ARAVE|nr:hypothetical protein AVEN_96099-1 [Araneus ventricosus]